MSHKSELGQYFTVSEQLQQFVFDIVKYKSDQLLEPSFGAGHLLKKFKDYNANYPMVCCELDITIQHVITFNTFQTILYGDFTKQQMTTKFRTIIGNPPYVKQKAKQNLYITFIELCYNYLTDDGELIFIVPSDFLKLTSASALIQRMSDTGSFTDFLFPHDEKLFDNASIDVVVFRYQKGIVQKTAIVNGKTMFCNTNRGIVTFSENDLPVGGTPIDVQFGVFVGLVSGRDEVYRVPFGNMEVLIDKDTTNTFIYADVFPTNDLQIDAHLQANKTRLLERQIKKFSDSNWFAWGAPRNISSMRNHWGKPCIYVRTITRNKEVAFLGTVQYFGGSLLCLIPKLETDLGSIVAHFNSPLFQKDYMYAGRFKIGHKQVCSVII
jgi:adenine-specific DNA-methyltransferase